MSEIPIDQILDPERPLRTDLSPESVEGLARSIKQVGLIEPLVVHKQDKMFVVIAGHRRLMAAEIAGLATVPCRIVAVDNLDKDIIKIHENIYRKDVNPVDEAEYYDYLIKTHGLTQYQLGLLLGFSETHIQQRLGILKYPDELKEALRLGNVGFAVARELYQIDDEAIQHQYTEYAVKHGVTSKVAENWRRQYKADRTRLTPKEEGIIKELKTLEPQRFAQSCFLCGNPIAQGHAKLLPVHPDCAPKDTNNGRDRTQ